MAVADKIDEYLDTLSLSSNTRSSYRSCLLAFLRWARENRYYTIGTAAKYYEADLRRKGEPSSGTITSYARTVRAFCKWYAENKKVELFDMSEAYLSQERPPLPPVRIDPSDVRFICNVAKERGEAGLRGRAMLLLALTCSLNPEQISAIMPEDACLSDTGACVRVLSADGSKSIEVELIGAAREALVDYLVGRGPVKEGLPLLAVTTTKSKRQAMQPADVRKCIVRMLDYLGYDYCDVFNGDCERAVAAYIAHLDDADKQELAALAARLYYARQDLG